MKELLKILLIENSRIKSETIDQILAQLDLNLKMTKVDSTQTAISTFKNNDFDCVLVRYPLPEEDAIALIKLLSILKTTVPIIVLSAQKDDKMLVEIMNAGACDYLSEPRITPEVIYCTLNQAIRIHQAEIELKQVNRRLRTRNQLLRKKNKELRRQRQKIKLQNLQLQQAYELKSQFLSTLSHELRTPMNSIMGFSQLLLSNYPDPLTSNQTDIVQRIYSNSQNLLTMINEVLDFSEIETGKMKVNLEKFNLADFVRITVEEIRSLAVQKNLTLDVDINLNNPIIKNDRFFCRSILLNLLSNAIKFTSEGKVLVAVKELEQNRLAITVKDTGIGIAPDSLKTIFEPFRQVDQTINRQYHGTGLGLAIINSLVQMMAGKIKVESKLNEGSLFQVEIPRTVQI